MSEIVLEGCRQNNLKNISLRFPHKKISVITGVSGAGKTSLAFGTLFVEAQRSFFACQSLRLRKMFSMPRPKVDYVEGLLPAVALFDRRQAFTSKDTVASLSGLEELLRLFFLHFALLRSPKTLKVMEKDSIDSILEKLMSFEEGERLQLIVDCKLEDSSYLEAMGFSRLRFENKELSWDEARKASVKELELIVDRLVIKEGVRERLQDSLQQCFLLSPLQIKVQKGKEGEKEKEMR